MSAARKPKGRPHTFAFWTGPEMKKLRDMRVARGMTADEIVPHLPRHTESGIRTMCRKQGWSLPDARRKAQSQLAAAKANDCMRKVHSVVRVFKDGACAVCKKPLDNEPCWMAPFGEVCSACVGEAVANSYEETLP